MTEFVSGGELYDRICKVTYYPEDKSKIIVKKLVHAVKYLQSVGVVHRDLKPENILLRSPEPEYSTDICIADFGLSKMITEEAKFMLTHCGTPAYVAPEVLSSEGYGPEVDMWSVGVITYTLLCGYTPFVGDTMPELLQAVVAVDYEYDEQYWEEVSNEAIDFIDNLLIKDPRMRLTPDEALEHPWLSDVVLEGYD